LFQSTKSDISNKILIISNHIRWAQAKHSKLYCSAFKSGLKIKWNSYSAVRQEKDRPEMARFLTGCRSNKFGAVLREEMKNDE
jgi:hypothetical protein